MPLPRLQLFELEDQMWFPRNIRDLVTDYLQFMEARFSMHKPAVLVIQEMLKYSKASRVLDLCSGGGGPIPSLYEALVPDNDQIQFTLTDKYPNLKAFERLSSQCPSGIRYLSDPVDATDVPNKLDGMRIMFNGFHHFPPEPARLVLENAVHAQQAIGVFEAVERSWLMLVSFLFVPVVVLLATPLIKPFRWDRLVWTYLIPIVPLTCCWDGLISTCRAYTVTEMLAMTQGFTDYEWKSDRVQIPGTTAHLTYLVGIPRVCHLSNPNGL